jgi:hypothetical protein
MSCVIVMFFGINPNIIQAIVIFFWSNKYSSSSLDPLKLYTPFLPLLGGHPNIYKIESNTNQNYYQCVHIYIFLNFNLISPDASMIAMCSIPCLSEVSWHPILTFEYFYYYILICANK